MRTRAKIVRHLSHVSRRNSDVISVCVFAELKILIAFLLLWLFIWPAVTLAAEPRPVDVPLRTRVKILESVADQVNRESDLTWHLYQMAMNMAIEEAKVEFQGLRSNQFIQQCTIGVDRTNSCLLAWREATRILETAFARRNVAGPQNEFRQRLTQLAEIANQSGGMGPVPNVEWQAGFYTYVIENHRAKKCVDLQQQITRSLTNLGNALTTYSSIAVSTRSILEPMRLLAERPSTEKVDLVWILLNSLDSVQSDLNRVKMEPSKEAKPSLYKLMPLRNIGLPG